MAHCKGCSCCKKKNITKKKPTVHRRPMMSPMGLSRPVVMPQQIPGNTFNLPFAPYGSQYNPKMVVSNVNDEGKTASAGHKNVGTEVSHIELKAAETQSEHKAVIAGTQTHGMGYALHTLHRARPQTVVEPRVVETATVETMTEVRARGRPAAPPAEQTRLQPRLGRPEKAEHPEPTGRFGQRVGAIAEVADLEHLFRAPQ